MTTVEVSAGIAALVMALAEKRGVDPEVLAAQAGLPFALVSDPAARFPIEVEQSLWDESARLCADPCFGLHAAESIFPGAFDVIDYAIRTAPTFGAGLARLARYNRLVHDTAVFELREHPEGVRIEHRFSWGPMAQSRHGAEFTLAGIVALGRQMTGVTIVPRAVGFFHTRPELTAEHTRIFGVEPSFGHGENWLLFEPAALALPSLAADPRLLRVIERQADALLADRPPMGASVIDRVRIVLAQCLGEEVLSLPTVAAKLNISGRRLQRKLELEGQTFEGVLDDVRRDLALRYLAESRLAVSEVAYLLGYSEASPLHRAVKRWTGKTPGEIRQSAR